MNASEESVYQLMSTPLVSIEPRTSVGEVLRLAEDLAIHHFPIVEGGSLLGIVCTCDLGRAQREEAVSQYAHPTVIIAPDSTAREAAERMLDCQVGSVVVADDEGMWGILTREDLAETVPELVQNTLCACCGSRQHLRHLSVGSFICLACAQRAGATSARAGFTLE